MAPGLKHSSQSLRTGVRIPRTLGKTTYSTMRAVISNPSEPLWGDERQRQENPRSLGVRQPGKFKETHPDSNKVERPGPMPNGCPLTSISAMTYIHSLFLPLPPLALTHTPPQLLPPSQ